MNQAECLKRLVESRLPGVRASLDAPLRGREPWFVDFSYQGHPVTVEWRRNRGFGISTGRSHGLGEGPSEVIGPLHDAAERVLELLRLRRRPAAPSDMSFSGLRKRLRLSQTDLARRLGVSQAAVSALESDPSRSRLATVRRALGALGAKLELHAVLPKHQDVRLRL